MLLLKEKWCTGCNHYKVGYYIACNIRPIIKGRKCPCITCLVKSMCTEACFKFLYYKHREEILEKMEKKFNEDN